MTTIVPFSSAELEIVTKALDEHAVRLEKHVKGVDGAITLCATPPEVPELRAAQARYAEEAAAVRLLETKLRESYAESPQGQRAKR